MSEVASPCISQCDLNESNVCKGCFRSLDEIGRWSVTSEEDKKEIVITAKQRSLNSEETQSNNDSHPQP